MGRVDVDGLGHRAGRVSTVPAPGETGRGLGARRSRPDASTHRRIATRATPSPTRGTRGSDAVAHDVPYGGPTANHPATGDSPRTGSWSTGRHGERTTRSMPGSHESNGTDES